MVRLTTEQRVFLLQQWWKHEKTHVVMHLFAMRFPDTPVPTRQTMYKLRKKFTETGSTHDAVRERKKSVRTDEKKQLVAETIVENPYMSIRRCAAEMDISRSSIHRIMHDLQLHPYHPVLLHSLKESDFPQRLHFSEVFLNQMKEEVGLLDRVLWTDEAVFKKNGRVNRHNCIYWSAENPHEVIEEELNVPGVCVWAGISSSSVVGPYFFEGTVTAASYTEMLTNYAIPFLQQQPGYDSLLWQQDGAPAHFSTAVRQHLDHFFPGRWIGRSGPIPWPARSPDLTPMDFSVWGIVKEKVFSRRPGSVEELKHFITDAFHTLTPALCQKICNSVSVRLQACASVEGRQFQHLL